jgi:hypothetical protein
MSVPTARAAPSPGEGAGAGRIYTAEEAGLVLACSLPLLRKLRRATGHEPSVAVGRRRLYSEADITYFAAALQDRDPTRIPGRARGRGRPRARRPAAPV